MATAPHTLRQLLQRLVGVFHRLRCHRKLTLAPLHEDLTPTTVKTVPVKIVQFPLDCEGGQNTMTEVAMVEVDYSNHETHVADLRRQRLQVNAQNYTQEGDDPNKRITNFPPSDRLH